MARTSKKRKTSHVLSELIYRSSIWNKSRRSFEPPDVHKRFPGYQNFFTNGQTHSSSKTSYSSRKSGLVLNDAQEQASEENCVNEEDVTDPWVQFCRQSSCHGVNKIGNLLRSRPISMLWLLITLCMAGGLLNSVVNLVISYYNYGTVTKTEVLVSHVLDFPSITICNICPYKNGDENGLNPISTLMAKTTIFGDLFRLEQDQNLQTTYAMNSVEIQQNYSFTRDELFWYGVYEGKTLNVSDAFEIVNTQYGRCFTFNGPQYIKEHGVRKVTYDGRYSGLHVMAQIWQSKYLIMDDMTAGLRLYIAQHPETPRLDKDGIDIHPGTSTKIALTPTKSKFMPEPYTSYGSEPCQDTEKLNLTDKMYDAPFYSYIACVEQCLDFHAAMNCSCYTATLRVKNLPPCTVEQDFFCFKPFKSELFNNHLSVDCDCPRPCASYSYTTTISNSQMPSRISSSYVLKLLGRDPDEIELLRDDYVDVKIYLESDKLREETHEPEYTFNSMLASLGGQMGFFLGASLVTITELMETICLWLYSLFRKKVLRMGQMAVRSRKIENRSNNLKIWRDHTKY